MTGSDPTPARDTRWLRDKSAKGIYWRLRLDGTKAWSFYDERLGRRGQTCSSRKEALAAQAASRLDRQAGKPAPDTTTKIRELAEEARASKERRMRPQAFRDWSDSLDRVVLPEVGHLLPAKCGPDRIARLIRDLEARGICGQTITKYTRPLREVLKLAVRRGIISTDPFTLLGPDERPKNSTKKRRFEWSPQTISKLLAAAEALDRRPEARQVYAPLLHVLALTGLRVGEALGLRWGDVDLLSGVLHVRHSLSRDGELGPPKTDAALRDVPLTPGLVELLLKLKPGDATDEEFVFAGKRGRPVSYWNARSRGFALAAKKAGLTGVTVHDLRHAAASLYIARGLSPVAVAAVLGHTDASTTLRIYAHLWDRSNVEAQIREAQASIVLPGGHVIIKSPLISRTTPERREGPAESGASRVISCSVCRSVASRIDPSFRASARARKWLSEPVRDG